MEFVNQIKHNYKENIRGYIIIWLLLLIAIAFCVTQTIQLYNEDGKRIVDVERVKESGYRDFIEFGLPEGMDLEEYFPVYVGDSYQSSIFIVLSLVIITYVFILSKRNHNNYRNGRLYVAISLLFYIGVIYGVLSWCDNVTVFVDYFHFHFHESTFVDLCRSFIFSFVCLVIYLSLCGIFYRISSWGRSKGYIFTILIISIILPIWIFISLFFLFCILFVGLL